MKHKLGITILAAVIALAGTREAFQQFDELKTSVADWTRTSILGNLLVFATDGAEADSPQPTILLAETYLACHGEKSHSATSRPASTTKAASAGHAKGIERSPRAHVAGELAMRFAVTRTSSTSQAKLREQIVLKVVPDIVELTKAFGAGLTDDETAGAVRARESGEARAARTRAAAELKKLGLKRVFIRVAHFTNADAGRNVFAFRLPEMLPTPFDMKSLALVGDATESTPLVAPAPSAPTTTDATFDLGTIFNAPPVPTSTLNCDSDPLS
ncbi:MAG: hypothetical protein QOF61_2146 [Acidobacteriota bacterium]|jgi:hypothetical protein|nr:hypothetical protein [Acidobacteriota bacterium]